MQNAHNMKIIVEYYETFRKMMEWFEIVPKYILNMDETSLNIGCEKAQLVITSHATKSLVMTDLDN